MKIGIVGAGMLGATLARRCTAAGHAVKLANARGPDSIRDLVEGMGTRAVTVAEAVADVDIIVVSIPQGAVETLSAGLFHEVPDDVVIIDTGNYYPGLRDQPIAEIEAGLAEGLWVSRQLGRPVVKALNSISFTSLADGGRASGAPGRIALPVSGDDPAAKAVVVRLLDEIGFDGVDAGALAESWRQQPGTPVYCTDLDREGVTRGLDLADKAQSPARRDQFIAQMLPALRTGEKIDLVALGRTIYGAP
ncbi:NADPH-dependent F420 reductase [Sphingobium nicotianae]|uniref:NAD(P)-binding domain-containing protein n=1 Tax=Sphingobium nicotianae TaxID=2782607 RepID=A0A9X1IS75_9SPHN|nr:NAD(P)-binding domain-containing protein [Sphingobium nicotianae]MBT2187875.1 NAD(P)-binding domain-containing protein [Sphingobium nicotianae]